MSGSRDVRALEDREKQAAAALACALTKVGVARGDRDILCNRRRDAERSMANTTAHDRFAEDTGRVRHVCDVHVDALGRVKAEHDTLDGLRERAERCRMTTERAEAERLLLVDAGSRLDREVDDMRAHREAQGLPGLIERRQATETLSILLQDVHRDHRRHVRATSLRALALGDLATARARYGL